MNIDQALEHITKKIGQNKFSTDYDKKCLNEIINYVESNRRIKMNGQQLFMKLYVYLYTRLLNAYDGSTDKPQSIIHKALELPIDAHIDLLTKALNDMLIYVKMDIPKVPNGDLLTVTDETIEKFAEIDFWSKKQVEDNIYKQAQKAVDKYY